MGKVKGNKCEKRDFVFKEDGQNKNSLAIYTFYNNLNFRVYLKYTLVKVLRSCLICLFFF